MWLPLLGLFLLCFSLLLLVAIQPRRFYEYPYFMAAAFTVFILPQAYGLTSNNWGGVFLQMTLLMSILCLAACWLGYLLPPKADILQRIALPMNSSRLLHGGLAFVGVGFFFNYLIAALPEEAKDTAWTGIVTIYGFFANLAYPGFAICFYCALRDRSMLAWLGTIISAIIPIQAAIFYGRREPTAMFVISLGLSLYFIYGRVVSRFLAVGAILIATFAVPATQEYRKLSQENPLTALKEIDFLEQFNSYFDEDSISELKNATALIAATKISHGYQFGAAYWNNLVYRFVPAQFLGKEFKTGLLIGGEESNPAKVMENVIGYVPPTGSTTTGIGDAFHQFGYFGCLFFGIVGYLFRHLWVASHAENGILPQVLYIQTMTSAILTVTHLTAGFLPSFLYMLVFIGIIALYAHEPTDAQEWSFTDWSPPTIGDES